MHNERLLHRVMAAIGVFLASALFGLTALRQSYAAGEPTVDITLDDSHLYSGETATVTFQFSAVPFNFDETDIDTSGAQGLLSGLAAGPDPRRWTATFTPTPATDDPTNVIMVGMAWNDSNGLAPVSTSVSPNFVVQTTLPPPPPLVSPSSSCRPPSVTLSNPSPGSTVQGGSSYDLFWTWQGCQAQTVRLSYSADGGITYGTPFASVMPHSGYHAWMVPDAATDAGMLRAELLGPGDALLASDDSDGTFTVAQAAPPAPTPPIEEPETEAEPPMPAELPAEPPSGTEPPAEPVAAEPEATETAPPTPAPAPAPERVVIPVVPASRPDAAPPIARTAPVNPQPAPETDMNTLLAQSEAPQSVTDAQATATTAEAVVAMVPQPLRAGWMESATSFAAGALTMLLLMFGIQQVMKVIVARTMKPCPRCTGSGHEKKTNVGPKPCNDCQGSGSVDEETEKAGECPHCKGEGDDPCHDCKGEGMLPDGSNCPACGGEGIALQDAKEGEEPEPKPCEVCNGEGEVAQTFTKKAPCASCAGTGKV